MLVHLQHKIKTIMEATVKISLEQFKRMESAELALTNKKENSCVLFCDFTHLDHRRYYLLLTKDELIEQMVKENEKLKNENKLLIQEKFKDKYSYKRRWWQF